ncbi:hypothetical protein Tco_0590157 [Tanacetum coccineum]
MGHVPFSCLLCLSVTVSRHCERDRLIVVDRDMFVTIERERLNVDWCGCIVRNPWSSLIPLSRGSFDVIMGMDRLSKRKFVIVCHEKVVRIPLEGDEILWVHGECTQGVVKTLMNTKHEVHLKLVLELLRKEKLYAKFTKSEKGRVKLRRVRTMSMTIQSSVKDKILATPSETAKVKNALAEMLRDLDQQMEKRADDGCTLWIKLYSKYEYEIRYHPGRANVVIDALRRKERVKPRNAAESVSDAIRFEYCLASSSGWTKSPVIWAEIGGSSLIGPELVQETTNKVVLVKEKPKAAGDRQKSYADNRRKPLEFEVGDRVMLKVSPWKGDIRFGKKGKLAPSLHVPLDEIKVDKTRCFVEEPVEIMDSEIKSLKRSKISLVKVHWNPKRGPEFTLKREDYMKSKYPQLFDDCADESAS